MQKGCEGTVLLQEANQKNLADIFFPGSLGFMGFIHMLSNMSQAALAM